MQKFILFFVIIQFLCLSCKSLEKNFETIYEPEHKVIDRGGKNVIIISKACSIFPDHAISAAKKSAEYQLRSVIGDKSHLKKLQKINHYIDGQKTCVVISAKALSSL